MRDGARPEVLTFPSPCGEKVVYDWRVYNFSVKNRANVSVPLRGKGSLRHGQTAIAHSQERLGSFRPLAGKR